MVNSESDSNENSFENIINEARNRGDTWIIGQVMGESMDQEIGSDTQVPVRLLPTDYPYKIGDTIVFKRGSRYVIHKIFDSYVYNQKEYFVTGGINQITNEKVDSATVSRSNIVGIPDLTTQTITGTQNLEQQGTLIYIIVNAMTNEFEGRIDRIGTKLIRHISDEIAQKGYDITTLAYELFPTSDHILEFLGMREGDYRYKTEFLSRFIDFLEATYNIENIEGIHKNDLEYLKFDLLGLCLGHFFKEGLTIKTLMQVGAPRDLISFATIQNFPTTWSIFKKENNYEFYKKLIEFRGNNLDLDYDKKLGGGEGKIFLSSKYPDKALKRWFSSQLLKFEKSIDLLDGARRMIENDPELKKYIEVVKIYEKGNDWILRDFYSFSYELRNALKSEEEARIVYDRVIALLSDTTDFYLMKVLQKLIDTSYNLHWDANFNKIIIIDMM
jgi:hypothetical protein